GTTSAGTTASTHVLAKFLPRPRSAPPAEEAGGSGAGAGGSGFDVALQLVQLALLVLDDRLDQVADRDHAQDRVAFDHRQVADAAFGDDLHAAVGGVVEPDGDHVGGHDVAHRRVRGG